jgi:hypothetical protein
MSKETDAISDINDAKLSLAGLGVGDVFVL